jgi:DNA-binding transcriptional MerR regulator
MQDTTISPAQPSRGRVGEVHQTLRLALAELSYNFVHANIYDMTEMSAGMMTTAQAAAVLGVSVRQVQYFVESGQIVTRGSVGRSRLLDSASVHRLATVGGGRGRAWKPATVWQAVALLDGRQAISVGTSASQQAQLSRLRRRLRQMDTEALVQMTRDRARVTNWRASDSYVRDIRKRVVVTAAAALDERDGGDQLAGSLGLTTHRWDGQVDGYVTAEELTGMTAEFFLVSDPGGNVRLRVVEDVEVVADQRYPFRAILPVIALDLAESIDVRERSAALRALSAMKDRV